MDVAIQGKGLTAQIDAATKQIQSIAGLKRLGAHEEVKEFWQKAECIMSQVNWQAQNDCLSGISKLTRTYTALEFTEFYSFIPTLIKYARTARQNAITAAQSLATAAQEFANLIDEVEAVTKKLESKAGWHEYWQGRDESAVRNYNIAGHIVGPLTLGLGYTLWLAGDAYQKRVDNHAQSLQIIKDVQGILRNKIGPIFHEASGAMDAAAAFFDHLSVKLHEVLDLGEEAAAARASEMHEHYLIMREVMLELRGAVQKLSACTLREDRCLAS